MNKQQTKNRMQETIQKAKKIKLLILDVDGVLTDGKLFFDAQGEEYKSFHVHDGLGIKLLQLTGVEVAVISGRKSVPVAIRMKNLGIKHVYQGHENKVTAFEELLKNLDLSPEQVAHMGDDLPDLSIMCRAGFALAVADAHFAVRDFADWCSECPGGRGAVREACDFIIQVQGNLQTIIDSYLGMEEEGRQKEIK